MTENDLPGGHSPAYFALLNQPLPLSPIVVAERSGGVRRVSSAFPRARDRAPVVGAGGRLEELPRAVDQRRLRAVLRRAVRAARARRRGLPRHAAADAPLGRSSSRRRARSISATGSATSRAKGASSAPSSTTRARWSCTCCGGWSATRRSSPGSASSTRTEAVPQGRDRRFPPAMEKASGHDLDASSSGGSTALRSACRSRLRQRRRDEMRFEHRGDVLPTPVTVNHVCGRHERGCRRAGDRAGGRADDRTARSGPRRSRSTADYGAVAELEK